MGSHPASLRRVVRINSRPLVGIPGLLTLPRTFVGLAAVAAVGVAAPPQSKLSLTQERRSPVSIDGVRQGRLLGWQEAWPPGWARRVVTVGLCWQWDETGPPPLRFSRPRRVTRPSILARVEGLLDDGVIEPTKGPYHLNHLFEVPKKDTSTPRLVLDVSYLNRFVTPYRFSMTSVALVRQCLTVDCFMASIDMKDAYWHVPVHRKFRPYLAFSAGGSSYQFRVLPFGLNIAPRVFSKMMKPVHSILSQRGVHLLMYLDDWLVFAPSYEECVWMVGETLSVGASMGLLFNLPKSHLDPSTSRQWLGMVWESTSQTVSLSQVNRLKCRSKLFRAIHSRTFSRRMWGSLMGSLNHAATVVRLGRLRMRRLLMMGNKVFGALDWDLLVPFPRRLRSLLQWWLLDDRLASSDAWTAPSATLSLTTDSSNVGWGYQSSEGHQGSGMWSAAERRLHINVKELLVVYLALCREPSLERMTVQVFSDSATAVHCINKQGTVRSSRLLKVTEDLLLEADSRGVSLRASHVAGTDNSWADALSRNSMRSVDWSLTEVCFRRLCKWAGTPQVDLFASPSNHRLPLYLTAEFKTPAGGPDAFLSDWNRWDYVYLFPPPDTRTMLEVFRHLEVFRGRVLLVAPRWEAQPWFPVLLRHRPRSLPLVGEVISQECSEQFLTSLRLTAWSF